jgi:Uma2 family endonuclease
LRVEARDLARAPVFWDFVPMEVLDPIQLHTRPAIEMSDDQFFDFCQINRDLRMERTAEGDILIMTPEAASSGSGGSRLNYYFESWGETNDSGRFFGPATGFKLPNGAIRAPDISWVLKERLKTVSRDDWNKFLPLCPDFVLELRSPSDRLAALRAKMEEYIANGARMGWLLDAGRRQVHIYRPGVAPQILDNPGEISGDPVLPNFKLSVPKIWAAMEPL